jgi:hypothetical protein
MKTVKITSNQLRKLITESINQNLLHKHFSTIIL